MVEDKSGNSNNFPLFWIYNQLVHGQYQYFHKNDKGILILFEKICRPNYTKFANLIFQKPLKMRSITKYHLILELILLVCLFSCQNQPNKEIKSTEAAEEDGTGTENILMREGVISTEKPCRGILKCAPEMCWYIAFILMTLLTLISVSKLGSSVGTGNLLTINWGVPEAQQHFGMPSSHSLRNRNKNYWHLGWNWVHRLKKTGIKG